MEKSSGHNQKGLAKSSLYVARQSSLERRVYQPLTHHDHHLILGSEKVPLGCLSCLSISGSNLTRLRPAARQMDFFLILLSHRERERKRRFPLFPCFFISVVSLAIALTVFTSPSLRSFFCSALLSLTSHALTHSHSYTGIVKLVGGFVVSRAFSPLSHWCFSCSPVVVAVVVVLVRWGQQNMWVNLWVSEWVGGCGVTLVFGHFIHISRRESFGPVETNTRNITTIRLEHVNQWVWWWWEMSCYVESEVVSCFPSLVGWWTTGSWQNSSSGVITTSCVSVEVEDTFLPESRSSQESQSLVCSIQEHASSSSSSLHQVLFNHKSCHLPCGFSGSHLEPYRAFTHIGLWYVFSFIRTVFMMRDAA